MSKIKLSKDFIRNTVKLALNEDLYPSGDITSNWSEADDTENEANYGSLITESSGIFTFPSTGIYHVEYDALIYHDAETPANVIQIQFTQKTIKLSI